METADSSPPAEVLRSAVRFPPFWADHPTMWIAQADTQFFFDSVSS
jgi:hypothetical protein